MNFKSLFSLCNATPQRAVSWIREFFWITLKLFKVTRTFNMILFSQQINCLLLLLIVQFASWQLQKQKSFKIRDSPERSQWFFLWVLYLYCGSWLNRGWRHIGQFRLKHRKANKLTFICNTSVLGLTSEGVAETPSSLVVQNKRKLKKLCVEIKCLSVCLSVSLLAYGGFDLSKHLIGNKPLLMSVVCHQSCQVCSRGYLVFSIGSKVSSRFILLFTRLPLPGGYSFQTRTLSACPSFWK